ncbi:hypothetical protein BKA62DRAFT_722231 [Auriculariales sp. MPI-PUGE-AT-0066]|nr:hypothetical protein BKA62DRAFT_722231 [Auriculariales sp. MPI-PUGE-AT-0066]
MAKRGAAMAPTRELTSRAHAGRRSKEKLQDEWTQEWRRATPATRGTRFAAADRFPPSLKPTPHFTALTKERELFARLTQCRTGHCFQGAYYKENVPSENIDCPCGEHPQTREHTLRHCPRYDRYRSALWDASTTVDLGVILGTRDGIVALAKFLRTSGAFTKTGHPRAPRTTPMWEDEPEDGGGWEEDREEGEE